jgi:hypothetical protein
LVTREGVVKITDFGIAKIGPRSQTQSGLIVGTPQYMAPEQYMGGVVDHRCDIHAAGAVLYELLTGSPPFKGGAAEVMYKVCHEVPKPASSINTTLPQVFDRVLAKALDKAAANRYASAGEFQEALRVSWEAVSSQPPSPTMSDRARIIATAISRRPVAPKVAPASGAPPAVPAPASSGSRRGRNVADSGSLTAWSREQLAEIERHLMAIMGPVARVLVQDAAATTASRQELYQLLASRLETPEERRRFLKAWGEYALTDPGEPPPRATNAIVFSNIVGRPLTPEATQRATLLLARYLGPIAGLLTRKAAQTAIDEAQLYSMLADKVTDAAERKRFITEAGRQR